MSNNSNTTRLDQLMVNLMNVRSQVLPQVATTRPAASSSQVATTRPTTSSSLMEGLQNFRTGSRQKQKRSALLTLEFALLPGPRTKWLRTESMKYAAERRNGKNSEFYHKKPILFDKSSSDRIIRAKVHSRFRALNAHDLDDFLFCKLVQNTFYPVGIRNPTAAELSNWKVRELAGSVTGGGQSKIWIMPKFELTDDTLAENRGVIPWVQEAHQTVQAQLPQRGHSVPQASNGVVPRVQEPLQPVLLPQPEPPVRQASNGVVPRNRELRQPVLLPQPEPLVRQASNGVVPQVQEPLQPVLLPQPEPAVRQASNGVVPRNRELLQPVLLPQPEPPVRQASNGVVPRVQEPLQPVLLPQPEPPVRQASNGVVPRNREPRQPVLLPQPEPPVRQASNGVVPRVQEPLQPVPLPQPEPPVRQASNVSEQPARSLMNEVEADGYMPYNGELEPSLSETIGDSVTPTDIVTQEPSSETIGDDTDSVTPMDIVTQDENFDIFKELEDFNANSLKRFKEAKHYLTERRRSPDSEENIAAILQQLVIQEQSNKNIIDIEKEAALELLMAKVMHPKFNTDRKLSVKFDKEDGVDTGALTASLLELVKDQLPKLNIFKPGPDGLRLKLNRKACAKKAYEAAGRVLAYMVALGGVLPQLLSPFLYAIVAYGPHRVSPQIHDIPDVRDQLHVYKIWKSAGNAELLNERAEFAQTITMAGCEDVTDKVELVESMTKFLAVDVHRNAIDQFVDGLGICGVARAISKNPSRMEEVFVYATPVLSADVLDNLFQKTYSNDKRKKVVERKVLADFRILMKDMEVEGILEQLLQFATGRKSVPVLGFDPALSIVFRHPESVPVNDITRDLPKAQACANQLTLPTGHKTTRSFLNTMHDMITRHYDRFDDY